MNECKGMNFTMTFDQVVRIDNGKGVIEQLQDDVKELQEEVDKLNTEVAECSDKLSGIEDGAERNVIVGIKVNGKLIPPVNRIVDIPISGGADIPSLDDAVDNGVGYDSNNNIVVKNLDIDRLVQDEVSELVLNGGSAI